MSTSLSQTSSVSPAPPFSETLSLLRAIDRQAEGRREEERGEEQAGSPHDALKLLRAITPSPCSSHTLKQESIPSTRDWTDSAPSKPRKQATRASSSARQPSPT